MKDKVCIVTGANSGIGYALALALASLDAHVVMVCRDLHTGHDAMEKISDTFPDAKVDLVQGNLGTLSATRSLAENLLKEYPDKIDVLIHNAGVWPQVLKRNDEDGLEEAFCVNHLAPFLLTQKLKERLITSSSPGACSRIVFVSAGLAVHGKVDLTQLPYGMDFSRMTTYRNTKLCSILTLKKWTKAFAGTSVTVNMVHPGVIRTNLGASEDWTGWFVRQVKKTWKTPDKGAEAPLFLATSDEVEGKTGLYYNEKEVMELPENCTNEQVAKEVWTLSMSLAGLEEEEEQSASDEGARTSSDTMETGD
eukprot:CAMPEP_0194028316 /NCGR_PEP_ID=MMETSP0009_2-20130614/2318_1 /TAXON_ID=210454 /ORGANISM="Grammatophora oceanica, Strain CCMP 410" /LENGTH=307 /DNA_ID=CAMNT_0038667669 /DNA_START=50 /DNA_END=973 /DNA_ORIENTATION=-